MNPARAQLIARFPPGSRIRLDPDEQARRQLNRGPHRPDRVGTVVGHSWDGETLLVRWDGLSLRSYPQAWSWRFVVREG